MARKILLQECIVQPYLNFKHRIKEKPKFKQEMINTYGYHNITINEFDDYDMCTYTKYIWEN